MYIQRLNYQVFPMKVRKRAKIRNRNNQAPHLTQHTNGKVTTSQTRANRSALSQQVTTTHQQRDMHESITKQDRNNINDPQKKHHLGKVSKNILLEGLNGFNGASTSPLVQMWIETHSEAFQIWKKCVENKWEGNRVPLGERKLDCTLTKEPRNYISHFV